MARSSHGPRRATTWTAEQNRRPAPRIVRLSRAANDNIRPYGRMTRSLFVIVTAAVAIFALVQWGVA